MKRNVFTYGSLMFPEVWSLVVTGTYRRLDARLDGHARYAIAGQSYPGMVIEAGSQVAGVLYLDVERADLDRLDHFEGDDYRRASVEVATGDDTVMAETYVYRLHDRLTSTSWAPHAFPMQQFIATYCRERLDP